MPSANAPALSAGASVPRRIPYARPGACLPGSIHRAVAGVSAVLSREEIDAILQSIIDNPNCGSQEIALATVMIRLQNRETGAITLPRSDYAAILGVHVCTIDRAKAVLEEEEILYWDRRFDDGSFHPGDPARYPSVQDTNTYFFTVPHNAAPSRSEANCEAKPLISDLALPVDKPADAFDFREKLPPPPVEKPVRKSRNGIPTWATKVSLRIAQFHANPKRQRRAMVAFIDNHLSAPKENARVTLDAGRERELALARLRFEQERLDRDGEWGDLPY